MQYSITVLLFLAVSIFHCCSSQSFSLQPQNTLKLKGNDITLTCQASGITNPSYYWIKDGVNVTRGTSGVSNSKAYLTIKALTFSDDGSYACRAVGNGNTITSSSAKVTIQGSPELVQPPSTTTSHEGYTVSFTCGTIANPKPTITWSHNGAQISSAGRFTIFAINGSLVVNTLTKADAGTYSCKAKNSYGEDSGFATLTVLDPPSPPQFTTTPSNTSATEGTMVTFYCQALGSPLPTINWTRIGGNIPSDRQSQPQPGALQISNLKPTDDGLYACVARNSQGKKVAYVHLSIKGYPKFTISPSNQVVKENSSALFNCAANSDPKPKISWQLPNGTIVSKETANSQNLQVLVNNTLSIATVKEQDEGTYTCIAQNSVGTKKAGAKLSVLTVPRFTIQLQNLTKTHGQDLVVTCPARANPTPNFQWLYKGNIIGANQQLQLNSLNVNNEGTYTCRVNNTMGLTTGTFYLRIIVPPTITSKPSNKTIGIGATARFSCQSAGDPVPSITWYKDGDQVKPGSRYSILANNTIVITKAVLSDRGWFTCRTSNAAGMVQERAYLFVTDIPKFTKLPTSTTVDITQKVVLTCQAVAKEVPRISWFKVDQAGSLQQVSAANVLASGNMQITSTQRSDKSNYVCRACNAAGCVTTPQVLLNVLYYPSFLVPPKDVGVLQGQDAVLKCEPDASPKANITWRLPNGEVFGGKDYTQIIRDVQPSKTGEYECEAENYLGKAGPVKFRLKIETKAVITHMTKVSSSLIEIITCQVNGIPLPLVAWYVGKDALPQNAKYPNYIVTRESKLKVPIGSLDKESFWCNATNPQNSDGYLVKAPIAPSSISATDIASNSIKVTWIRPSPQYFVTHYQLEKWSADTFWEVVNNNTKDLSYAVTRLSAFTVYQFRLKAVNGLGASNYSMMIHNVSTLSSTPSSPRSVTTFDITASEIKVKWSVPQNLNGPLNDINYRVTYYPKLPNITNDFNMSHDAASNHSQLYTISDLQADVLYSINVFAWRRRQDGKTFMSSGVSSSSRTLQIVPKTPPIGLVVVSNGPYQIIAKWEKPTYSVRGYNILFMQNVPGANFTKFNIPNGAATTYVIMDLKEDTVYLTKVQMYSNVDDQGPFSDVIEVRTETDKFGAIAGKSTGGRSTSWEVAVGGLVCGILLLVIVSVIVWCWWNRTRQSNQTFQISTRRRRAPSSIGSGESVEGQYNIGGFNPELDTDLDLEMFAQNGNVVPITTSYRNERAIAYINPSILHESSDYNVQGNDNIYENQPFKGKVQTANNSRINNNGSSTNMSDRYDGNQKTLAEPSYEDLQYAQVDMSKKTRKPSEDSVPNQPPKGKVQTANNSRINNGGSSNNMSDRYDGNQKTLAEPSYEVPQYAQVDMSKKTRKPSEDSVPVPPSFEYPDDLSEPDVSDVPYPDEDLPPLERKWTNVSEFNFPPPPSDPPPVEHSSTPAMDDTPNIVPLHEEPSYKPPSNSNPIPKDKGLQKRRMVASWAEEEDEPIGNLWETVDKELDRRLGTT